MSADRPDRVAELVSFALERLPAMQLEDGAFCHEVVRGDPHPRGRSLRYSAIVLLGLLRAEQAGIRVPFETDELKALLVSELDSGDMSPGDVGLLLWADSRSGLELASRLVGAAERRLDASGGLDTQEGLELAWLVLGLTEAIAAGHREPQAERLLNAVVERMLARVEMPHGLFRHSDVGWRARFPHFATQIYGVQALAELVRLRGQESLTGVARRIADLLVRAQLRDGGWAWVYDVRRGTVVEPYRVYSVHQVAMAQLAMHPLHEISGDARYREATERGFPWVWGENEAGAPMLDRAEGLMYRSVRRRGALDRLILWANTASSYAGRPLMAGLRGPIEIEATDRPYHHGWVLEAWCGERSIDSEGRR